MARGAHIYGEILEDPVAIALGIRTADVKQPEQSAPNPRIIAVRDPRVIVWFDVAQAKQHTLASDLPIASVRHRHVELVIRRGTEAVISVLACMSNLLTRRFEVADGICTAKADQSSMTMRGAILQENPWRST